MPCVVEMQVISGPQLHHRSKLVLPHFHASGGSYNCVCVCVTHTLVIENENVWYHNTDTTFALSYALCSTSCSLTVLRDMSTFAMQCKICTKKKSKYHGKVMASNYNMVL